MPRVLLPDPLDQTGQQNYSKASHPHPHPQPDTAVVYFLNRISAAAFRLLLFSFSILLFGDNGFLLLLCFVSSSRLGMHDMCSNLHSHCMQLSKTALSQFVMLNAEQSPEVASNSVEDRDRARARCSIVVDLE